MWGERNCLSFKTAVDGIEPPSPRLTVRSSTARPPLPSLLVHLSINRSAVRPCNHLRIIVHVTSLHLSCWTLATTVSFLQVRSTIRMKVNRWQDGRSVATRYTRASTATNLEQISLARGSVNLNSSPLIAINGKVPKDFARNNNENCSKSAEMIMLNNR